jgi:hypothetical protein
MPSPTTAAIPPRPSPHLKGSEAAAPLGAAAGFAAAEMAGGLILGAFFVADRAEALIFLLFRPPLLLLGALLVAGWGWRRRLLFYAAAIGLAAAAETILMLELGADRPWPEAARGLAGGVAAAAVADLLVQAGRRWRKGLGAALGALVFFLVYTTIGVRAYEAVVIDDPAPHTAAVRPALLLMTSLPIVWGEGGAFDAASRPAAAYRLLEREFAVRPIDAIEPDTLRGRRLMLLAQPRLLAPEEMVALDQWVREGGRILILADERLAWPSDLPPGDARRPPAASLLHPLLGHWGLRLDPGSGGVRTEHQGERRLRLDGPGQLAASGAGCRVAVSWFARCRIGAGEAIVVADADLLHDRLWAPADGRHRRLADNGLLVADWLDSLAALDRPRTDGEIAWIDPGAERGLGLILAALPIVLALLAALALGRFDRS